MSAPLDPAGMVVLIVVAWAAVGLLLTLGTRPRPQPAPDDGPPLTAAEQAALDQLEQQLREQA